MTGKISATIQSPVPNVFTMPEISGYIPKVKLFERTNNRIKITATSNVWCGVTNPAPLGVCFSVAIFIDYT